MEGSTAVRAAEMLHERRWSSPKRYHPRIPVGLGSATPRAIGHGARELTAAATVAVVGWGPTCNHTVRL